MSRRPNHLLIAVLLLGFAFDFLFWKQGVGVNLFIFLTLSIIGGLSWLLVNQVLPSRKSLWLLVIFVFFAILTFMRQEPLTEFLAVGFAFLSIWLFVVSYVGGRWIEYSIVDYINQFFSALGGILSQPIRFAMQLRKERMEQPTTGRITRKVPLIPILRGLLLAVPIVACFASLLASADLVFASKITEFFKSFNADRIAETIYRSIAIIFTAYLLAGIFLHAASKSKDEKLLGEDAPLINPILGFTETAIVLGSVTILFLLFVIVQFQYFFGGNANIGLEGYTYSQYARRGFNELVIVAFFSLLLILGLSLIAKRENNIQRNVYSGLSVAIVAQVIVILVSAYQRLLLAIDWHGFSRLRFYPQVFLVWVGILLLTVAFLEIRHMERYFTFAALMASIGFAISISVFNVDAAIVHRNVLRATQGRHFNVHYLSSLSIDAVPALVDEYLHSNLPDSVREGVGASLLCYQNLAKLSNEPRGDWRSFDFSLWQAQKSLEQVQPYLVVYRVNTEVRPIRVRTPANVLYECPVRPFSDVRENDE